MLSNVKMLARGSQADGAGQTIGNAELSGGGRWTLDFCSSALLRAETTSCHLVGMTFVPMMRY